MSKTTKRNIIITAIAVLLSVFVSTLIGTLSDGYENIMEPSKWAEKDINPDNYIKADNYVLETKSYTEGIEIELKENGIFKVSGENKTDVDFTAEICTVTLPAGKYTFTSGANGASASKWYLKAGSFYADFNNNTFELSEETDLTVVLTIKPGEEISKTFSPVIVTGAEAGSFYLD